MVDTGNEGKGQAQTAGTLLTGYACLVSVLRAVNVVCRR